jgi:hypothetical protein
MNKNIVAWTLGMAAMAVGGWAAPLDIHYGVNEVDINGDGVKDLIVRVRWDNMNAHSFDKYMIALRLDKEDLGEPVSYDVPIGKTAPYNHPLMMTEEGMDCVTKDDRAIHSGYVFSLNDKGYLEVKEFNRIWKEPADAYPVEVTTYRLTDASTDSRIDEEIGVLPGDPSWYLKEVKKVRLKRKVCDVRELMK